MVGETYVAWASTLVLDTPWRWGFTDGVCAEEVRNALIACMCKKQQRGSPHNQRQGKTQNKASA